MKKIFITQLILVLILNCYSQKEEDIEWNNIQENISFEFPTRIKGQKDSSEEVIYLKAHYETKKPDYNHFFLEKYDASFQSIRRGHINHIHDGKKLSIIKAVYFNKSVHVFLRDEFSDQENILYKQKYSAQDLSPIGEIQEFIKITPNSITKKHEQITYRFKFSCDKSKFVVQSLLYNKSSKTNVYYGMSDLFYVYDSNTEELIYTHTKKSLPSKKESYYVKDYALLNNGRLIVDFVSNNDPKFISNFITTKNWIKKHPSTKHFIEFIDNKNKFLLELKNDVNFSEYAPYSHIRIDEKNGYLYWYQKYLRKNENKEQERGLRIKKISIKEVSIIKEFRLPLRKSKREYLNFELLNFYIDNLNGGFLISFVKVISDKDKNNDIVLIKVNKNYEVEWKSNIQAKRKFHEHYYFSHELNYNQWYKLFIYSGSYYVFFNSYDSMTPENRETRVNGISTFLHVFDTNGTTLKQKMVSPSTTRVQPILGTLHHNVSGEIKLYGLSPYKYTPLYDGLPKKRFWSFGKISLK